MQYMLSFGNIPVLSVFCEQTAAEWVSGAATLICYNSPDSLSISNLTTVSQSINREDRNSGYRTETSNDQP
jgi:hypothetical protein